MGLEVAGYGLVRGLSREGVKVTGLWHSESEAAHHSRYCDAAQVTPNSDEAWMRVVLDEAARLERPALFPSTDRYVELIVRMQDQMRPVTRFHWVPRDLLDTVLDKARMHAFCERIGVPVPRTHVPQGPDLERQARDFVFPCLVKPRTTFRLSLPGRSKAIVCDTPAALLALYHDNPPLLGTTLWQEIIEGRDDAIYQGTALVTRSGELGAMACVRKIRQYRPSYGITSFGVTEWQDDVVSQTARLLRELRWRGLASVEFKRSARDGRYYFIEMNPRLPWYNGLFRDAGINLGLLTLLDLLDQPLPPVRQTNGIAWMSLPADLGSFWERRTSGSLSLIEWLPSLGLADSFAWYDRTDPGPLLSTTARLSGLGWRWIQEQLGESSSGDRGRENA